MYILSFPSVIGIVFGLATCLELSRLITLYTRSLIHRVRWETAESNDILSLSLLFRPSFILNYNFADQETAQSRNLSQSPNPDLVLGPRLRGQSPGRSPNPKPSLPQSESSRLIDILYLAQEKSSFPSDGANKSPCFSFCYFRDRSSRERSRGDRSRSRSGSKHSKSRSRSRSPMNGDKSPESKKAD